eukprot:599274-Ditylum_brightwellii.AAC.1
MVATVETQFTAMFTCMMSQNNNKANEPDWKTNTVTSSLPTATQHQAPITSEGMKPPLYATYPPALYYPPYPHHQMYWRINTGIFTMVRAETSLQDKPFK